MLRTTLAGLQAHKLRLILTAVAITLGVGFIAGTFVLTDTMKAGYDQKFAASADKVAVAVLPKDDGPSRAADDSKKAVVSPAALAKIRALPGVTDAQGIVRGSAPLLGKDGHAVGDVPTVGISVPAGGKLLRYDPVSGKVPATAGEAVLDKKTAERTGFKVGDTIRVLDPKGVPHDFRLSGLLDFGVDQEIAFRGAVGFAPGTATQMTGDRGFAEVDIAASDGVSHGQLRSQVATAVGGQYEVLTGEQLGAKLAKASGADTVVITTGLLIFGMISLLVAALVIYNTFSILIAQRMREFALLRCVGATRRQVFGSVVIESAVVGLVGSLLGIVVGAGLGIGGLAMFDALGADLPTGGFVLAPRTIVVALLVGVIVTVFSAMLPARTATKVAPVAALRQQTEPGGGRFRLGWVRAVLSAVLGGLGLAGVALGTAVMKPGESALYIVGIGAVFVFAAVLALMPVFIRPLSRAVGALPGRLAGVPGRLAVENSRRAPRRTATTTIALTVGVGLMSLFAVVGASIKATAGQSLDRHFPVDYALRPQYTSEQKLPRELAEGLRRHPQLASVTEIRGTSAQFGSEKEEVGAVTQASLGTAVKPDVKKGSFADFRSGAVAVDESTAKAARLSVGSSVPLQTERGTVQLKVAAIFGGDTPLPAVLVPEADFDRYFGAQGDQAVYVNARKGVPEAAARTLVDAAIKPYPTAKVTAAAAVKDGLSKAIDTMLMIFAGLLGLAIIIALFGIANTLTLSVVERTRESALLRALGLTKRQLRRMLSVEALVMAVIGALVGVALGGVFGWAATMAVSASAVFVVPYLQIIGFVVLAGLAGILAAVLPGRRAAKTSIVAALADE